jgi:hypothetical protein
VRRVAVGGGERNDADSRSGYPATSTTSSGTGAAFLRTTATNAGALGRGAGRWRSFDDQPVSAEAENPFCAANCAAVRPLLRQASTRSRQRASRSGLRVRMRVTVRERREVRNDADSRSGYDSSSPIAKEHTPPARERAATRERACPRCITAPDSLPRVEPRSSSSSPSSAFPARRAPSFSLAALIATREHARHHRGVRTT